MTQGKLLQRVKMITVFASVLLFALIGVVGYQYIKLGMLSKREDALDAKIGSLSVTQANLESGIDARSSDAYIEQQARESLGMIKSEGEVVYVSK